MMDRLGKIEAELAGLRRWKSEFVDTYNLSGIEGRVAVLGDAVAHLLGARLDDLQHEAETLRNPPA